MSLVVVEDIADHLVEHGEESVEGSQASEVHDVVQLLCMHEGLHNQPARGKVSRQQVGTVRLDLAVGREGGRGRGSEGGKVK